MYTTLLRKTRKSRIDRERKFLHHVPYEPRARHAFLSHAFSRKNIGFVSDRKINDDENRDKQRKKSGDTLSSRNLRIEAGWLGWSLEMMG